MMAFEHCATDLEVQRLLAHCILEPSPQKLAELCARYDATPGWMLVGLHIDTPLVGVVGVRMSTPGHAVIQHIAVLPESQRRGIGRRLIQHLVHHHQLHHLEAETDGDAVGFYRCCGFAIHSLGEIYPGVERFHCFLETPANRSLPS